MKLLYTYYRDYMDMHTIVSDLLELASPTHPLKNCRGSKKKKSLMHSMQTQISFCIPVLCYQAATDSS